MLDTVDAAGIYLWDVSVDAVFADDAAAEIFGFDAGDGQRGLAISNYLDRIHPEDLPRVASAVREAVMLGTPYHEEYRICRPDGTMIEVVALGTCFRNPAGEPCQYAGILFPKEVSSESETTIRQLCLMAHEIARKDGQVDVADKLVEALVALGPHQFGDHLPTAPTSRH